MCNLSTSLSRCIRRKEPVTYVLSKYSTRASVPSGVQPLRNVIPSVTSVSGRKASPSSMPQNNLNSSSVWYWSTNPSCCTFLHVDLLQGKMNCCSPQFLQDTGQASASYVNMNDSHQEYYHKLSFAIFLDKINHKTLSLNSAWFFCDWS